MGEGWQPEVEVAAAVVAELETGIGEIEVGVKAEASECWWYCCVR